MIFIDLVVKSVLIAALGWLAVSQLRRCSASTRHMLLVLTLVGLCVLPGVVGFLPHWHLPFLRLNDQTALAPARHAFAQVGKAVPAPHAAAATVASPAKVVLIVWAAVAALLGLQVVVRLLRLGQIERKLQMAADPTVQALVTEECRRSGRHVLLLEGSPSEPPMMWGHSRPVLLLPGQARSWPEDRLHSVILHELAHIERRDWMASMFAQLACIVFWFNPFVWIIKKRMEIESEIAADDRVLGMGVSATNYASHLVDVSKELRRSRSSTGVALAMARPGKLDQRIRTILEERRSRRSIRGGLSLGLAGLVACIVAGVGAATPTFVHKVLQAPPVVKITVHSAPDQDAQQPQESPVTDNSAVDDSAVETGSVSSTGDHQSDSRSGPTTDSLSSSDSHEAQTASTAKSGPRKPARTVKTEKMEKTEKGLTVSSGPKATSMKETVSFSPSGMTISSGGKDGDDDGVSNFDTKKFQAEMKHAGIEASKEVAEAMREVRDSTKGAKNWMPKGLNNDQIQLVINSAIKMGSKTALDALKSMHITIKDKAPAGPKKPLNPTPSESAPAGPTPPTPDPDDTTDSQH